MAFSQTHLVLEGTLPSLALGLPGWVFKPHVDNMEHNGSSLCDLQVLDWYTLVIRNHLQSLLNADSWALHYRFWSIKSEMEPNLCIFNRHIKWFWCRYLSDHSLRNIGLREKRAIIVVSLTELLKGCTWAHLQRFWFGVI